MKRLGLILLLACAALAPPAGARPAPDSSPLVRVPAGYKLDDRYGVRPEPDRDRIVIRDTKTRSVKTFHTTCTVPPTFAYYHRRYLLLQCGGADPHYEVVNVVSLVATRVPDVPNDVYLSGPGSQWVFGWTRAGGAETTVYINWHTGERRDDAAAPPAASDRDLDDPDLGRRQPGSEYGDVLPLRRGRYTVSRPASGARAGQLFLGDGSRRVRLSRCAHWCDSVQIVRGLVVWAEGSAIRGYALPSGRRLRWPARRSLRFSPIVVASDWELYIVAFNTDPYGDDDATSRWYVTRWRRALR